jgi:hypothetical protein
MTELEAIGTLWVCTDCMTTRETGEDPDVAPDREPWGTLDAGAGDVTPGLLWSEHYDPAGCESAFDSGGECGCDREDFVHGDLRPCDGCGSSLGGSRYAYTLWGRTTVAS